MKGLNWMIYKFPPRFKIYFLYSHTQKQVISSKDQNRISYVENCDWWDTRESLSSSALIRWGLCYNICSCQMRCIWGGIFTADWHPDLRWNAEELPLEDHLYFVHWQFSISNILIMSSLFQMSHFSLRGIKVQKRNTTYKSPAATWPREQILHKRFASPLIRKL